MQAPVLTPDEVLEPGQSATNRGGHRGRWNDRPLFEPPVSPVDYFTRFSSQIMGFCLTWTASAVAFYGLYALLRLWMSAQPANLVAYLVCVGAIGLAGWRLHRRTGLLADQRRNALLGMVITMALTSMSLGLLVVLNPLAGVFGEMVTLLLAHLVSSSLMVRILARQTSSRLGGVRVTVVG